MMTSDRQVAAASIQMEQLEIDANGWCKRALILPSPNFNARPNGVVVDLLVIHNISLPAGQFSRGVDNYIADLFLNQLDCDAHPSFESLRGLEVSSHFVIARDGALMQFVSTHDRAWHAGVSSFEGRVGCNDFSIGIELEGCDELPFEPDQYATLYALTLALGRHSPTLAIVGHQDIAPVRKTDPGPCFDWSSYHSFLAEHQNSSTETSSPMSRFRFPNLI
jgi:N-acetyl-anhydromuramoyl-L-alanine amidase